MRFGFLINEVVTGLRRNVTMTIAMILTTAISIGLVGGGLLVLRLADQSRDIYLDRVETQVFLTDDISANDLTCDSPQCQALRQASVEDTLRRRALEVEGAGVGLDGDLHDRGQTPCLQC